MSYQSLKEIEYQGPRSPRIIIVSSHGAGADDFLAAFPQIEEDRQMQAIWPLFQTYLAIERDVGADELTHAIAHNLARGYGRPCLTVAMNYPRAIIDGGRLLDYCLRPCLPTALFVSLKEAFLALHQKTLQRMEELYAEVRREGSCLIDVHSMASFCPIDGNGERYILPVSFHRLEDYVTQFLEARNHSYRRNLDLITADEQGRNIADPKLLASFQAALEAEAYPFIENRPYCASSPYLSHHHMKSVSSISFDVPKHFLASWSEDFTNYQLDDVPLDGMKIERLGRTLARAIDHASR